jgi:hypothetical protein
LGIQINQFGTGNPPSIFSLNPTTHQTIYFTSSISCKSRKPREQEEYDNDEDEDGDGDGEEDGDEDEDFIDTTGEETSSPAGRRGKKDKSTAGGRRQRNSEGEGEGRINYAFEELLSYRSKGGANRNKAQIHLNYDDLLARFSNDTEIETYKPYDVKTHASWLKICKRKRSEKKLHRKLKSRAFGRTQVVSPFVLGMKNDAKVKAKIQKDLEIRANSPALPGFVFDNTSLRKAVKMWTGRRNKALVTYGPISTWNTSQVTDMSCLFQNRRRFNDDLSGWDVRKVHTMCAMFENCIAFNQPLDSWDVSGVKQMKGMFHNATSFNQPLHQWNVSQVRSMQGMFRNASAFNTQALLAQAWSVVPNTIKETWFDEPVYSVVHFDQQEIQQAAENILKDFTNSLYHSQFKELDNFKLRIAVEMWHRDRHKARVILGDIANWNTSQVTDMHSLFSNRMTFNDDISGWDTSRVVTMKAMFKGACLFNQPLDRWNVAKETSMKSMFRGAVVFDQALPSGWNLDELRK